MVKISIIGGTGAFGRLFARLFKEEGHEVVITGRDVAKGEKVAKEVGVAYTSDNAAAASAADVVVISVFIENTVEVIREVAPHVRPGSLLMDVTSVKVEPVQAMEEHAPKGVEIIGTHPMFGPRVQSMEGLVFLVAPVRADKWQGWLMDFLDKNKAKVYTTTPEEHDRIMGVVQGLTHFTYLAVASTLRELDMDVDHTRRFASPIYELMLDLIARIVGQSPRLYASIQMHNPMSHEVQETFIKQAERLKDIVAEKDRGAFKGFMVDAARNMGDLDSAMGRSDKAIHALTEELQRLARSVGNEVAMQHIYSGAVHIGVVHEVGPESITLKTRAGKETVLKLSNVELLDQEALIKWKKENIKTTTRDLSVLLPKEADGDILGGLIEGSHGGITSCRVIDTYEGDRVPGDKKSITFRIEAIDFDNPDFEVVQDLFRAMGGSIR